MKQVTLYPLIPRCNNQEHGMKKLIYIKVQKGYLLARTVGETNDRQFHSKGLSHPRSLAGEFLEVEKTFKEAIAAQPKALFGLIKPRVLIHLIPEMEGGYTDLELRFFKEAAFSREVSEVYITDNKFGPLADGELGDLKKFL